MKDFTTRFHAPPEVARPRGCRLLEAFSPKLTRPIRLFERASFEQWIRLEADPKALRAGLGRPGGSRSMSRQLRHCPRCMTLGYHGVVHQFLGAMQCPAHGDWLEEGCRVCGHKSDYRLDAQLLGAPFQCALCRRPYGRSALRRAGPRPLPACVRTAITRAYCLS